jgi:hypothetical protein
MQSYAEPQKLTQEAGQPDYAKPIPPGKLKEDLDFLFKTIEDVHPDMYAYTSKQEFMLMKEQLYKKFNQPMNCIEFYKLVAPVVASLKSHHTSLKNPFEKYLEYTERGGKLFPLHIYLQDNKPFVKNYYGPIDIPKGSKILKINNQDSHRVISKIGRYFSDEGKDNSPRVLEYTDNTPIYLWIEFGPLESLQLEVETPKGVLEKFNLKPITYERFSEYKKKRNAPIDNENRWTYQYIPEYNTGLIDIIFFGPSSKQMKKFVDKTFEDIHKQEVSSLIIDLRQGMGGSSEASTELLKYLISRPFRQFDKVEVKISRQVYDKYEDLSEKYSNAQIGSIVDEDIGIIHPLDEASRFKGKVFVLIGHRTVSDCTTFAQVVRFYRAGKLIGEETADPTVRGAEYISFKLPYSDLNFCVTTKKFVLVGGKPGGRGVIPDYEVKQKPEDTAKGVDTVLQFALNLIKNLSSESLQKTKEPDNLLGNHK